MCLTCLVSIEDNEIIHKVTTPYSLESNRVAKEKNRTLKKMMNCLFINSIAPINLLGKAILTGYHIQNRISHKKIWVIPYELWKGYAPNLSYLKVWGCLVKIFYFGSCEEKDET